MTHEEKCPQTLKCFSFVDFKRCLGVIRKVMMEAGHLKKKHTFLFDVLSSK